MTKKVNTSALQLHSVECEQQEHMAWASAAYADICGAAVAHGLQQKRDIFSSGIERDALESEVCKQKIRECLDVGARKETFGMIVDVLLISSWKSGRYIPLGR